MTEPTQVRIDIDAVQFASVNPKLHDLGALASSEMRYGFVELPVVNATTGKLVAGQGRLEALRAIKKEGKPPPLGVTANDGHWEIDARSFPFPDDNTAQAYLLDSNNLGLLGGDFTAFDIAKLWDESAYLETLQQLAMADALPISVSGEDVDALNLAINPPEPETTDVGALIDKAEELQAKWQVARGQLWDIASKSVPGKSHRILCGDSTRAEDVARLMQGEKAAIVSDAPYGVSVVAKNGKIGAENLAKNQTYVPIANDDTTQTAKDFYNLCVKLGYSDFILWGGNYFTDFLPPRACWIVWDKREGMTSNNFADCEIAWTSFDLPARVYHHLWNGMIRKGNDGKKQHPTQKPVGLHVDILNDFTKRNAIIFDGFLGSGTTLIVAEQVGRIGRGCEISPAYVAVSLERLSALGLDCQRVE